MVFLRAVLGSLALLTVTVSGQQCKCERNMLQYYKELGCTEVAVPGSCCPAEFNCQAALSNRDEDKCHLNGKSYAPKDRITSVEAGNPCVPSCICDKFGPQASFQCAHNDCPELFQDRLPENCVRLYTQDTCCSTGTHCANATANTSPPKPEVTCEYSGKSYVAGQKFYPKEEPCKQCICQEGYDGTLKGPWCTDISCGIELHYGTKILDGCAPIYFGQNGCCPIGWRCPQDSDTVVKAVGKKVRTTTAQCKFGKLELNVFDKLSKEKECVQCACAVPPHVTCIQKGYC